MGLALDEQDEDDEIMIVDGIKVAVDPSIEYEAKNVTIDYVKGVFVLTNKNFC